MNKQFVPSSQEGIERAKNILYKISDTDTVLFLSGGKTPQKLYEDFSREKKLKAGAVAMIDERFGKPFHENSNERMLRKAGLLDYLYSEEIPFYPIIQDICNVKDHSCHSEFISESQKILNQVQDDRCRKTCCDNLSRGDMTREYNNIVKKLFGQFSQRVAILGIGTDGHTASLPSRLHLPLRCNLNNRKKLVMDVDNFPSVSKERITLTFRALEQMDFLLVLVFGEDKKEALGLAFSKGSEEEVPARFFTRPGISKRTLLITDQKV